jgi:hypothetical protein
VIENKRGNLHLARAHARDQYLQISPRGAIPHVRAFVLSHAVQVKIAIPHVRGAVDRSFGRPPREANLQTVAVIGD